MKKLLLIIISILSLSCIAVILLIPTKQNLMLRKNINYPGNAVVRLLHDNERMKKCLPDNINRTDFKYKAAVFHQEKELINGIEIIVDDDGNKILGTLEVLGMETSQCQLSWSTNAELSKNPFLKLVNYFQFKSLSKKITSFMDELSAACNVMENLYDVKIEKIQIEESSMVSASKEFDHFPNNEEIYSLISSTEKYIADNNGHANGSPMQNITTEDSIHYSLMTAIPTSEEIQGNGSFKLKKMMMGNMLKATYTGGPHGIENAKNQLRLYVEDYKKIPAAIPFEKMITNRIQIADTSKWITELYYPVFY